MRTLSLFLVSLLLLVFSSRAQAPLLSGPAGLSHQVDKYLLDRGIDPSDARRSGQVVVRVVPNGEALTHWGFAGIPVPQVSDLDVLATAVAVITAPPSHLKRVGDKWQLKTQAELDADFAASPAGVLKGKRGAVRASLTNELRTAGFTNAVPYTTDEVYKWLDTATINAAAEKKILRWLSQYENLTRPVVRIDAD